MQQPIEPCEEPPAASAQNVRPCSFLGSGALEIDHLDRLFLRRKVARRRDRGAAQITAEYYRIHFVGGWQQRC